MNTKLAAILVGTFLIVSAAAADAGSDTNGLGDWRVELELDATEMGAQEFAASGIAVKAEENGIELFGIRVVAKCEDGSIFVVRGRTRGGKEFDIGAIRMFLGSGKLVLTSSKDPSDVFPLSNLSSVAVYSNQHRGEVLTGSFLR